MEGGVKESENFVEVINGSPLTQPHPQSSLFYRTHPAIRFRGREKREKMRNRYSEEGGGGHGCQMAKFETLWIAPVLKGVGAQSKEKKGSNFAV